MLSCPTSEVLAMKEFQVSGLMLLLSMENLNKRNIPSIHLEKQSFWLIGKRGLAFFTVRSKEFWQKGYFTSNLLIYSRVLGTNKPAEKSIGGGQRDPELTRGSGKNIEQRCVYLRTLHRSLAVSVI